MDGGINGRAGVKISNLTGWGERKTARKGILLVAATIGIFTFLFSRIDLELVISTISGIKRWHFISAALLTFTFPVMTAARLHLTLKGLEQKAPFRKCLLAVIGVWPLGAVSPSRVGDLLRAYSLRKGTDAFTVTAGIVAEHLLDVVVLALFGLAGGLALGRGLITLFSGGVLLAVLLASALALRLNLPFPGREKFRDKFRTARTAFRALGKKPSLVAAIIILTAANWFGSILQVKILLDGLGAGVPLGFTAAALPVAIFIGLIPVTITGMGTRDAAMVTLFAAFAAGHQALAAGLLYSFLDYWMMSLVGIPFVKKALS